jgi:hypothetical protein
MTHRCPLEFRERALRMLAEAAERANVIPEAALSEQITPRFDIEMS